MLSWRMFSWGPISRVLEPWKGLFSVDSLKSPLRKTPRLKSRKPTWRTAIELNTSNFDLQQAWKTEWSSFDIIQSYSIARNIPGHDLPRKHWSALNHVRIGHGSCGFLMHKWKILPTPNYDCGHPNQTICHIISECPNRKCNESLEDFSSAPLNIVKWLANVHPKL